MSSDPRLKTRMRWYSIWLSKYVFAYDIQVNADHINRHKLRSSDREWARLLGLFSKKRISKLTSQDLLLQYFLLQPYHKAAILKSRSSASSFRAYFPPHHHCYPVSHMELPEPHPPLHCAYKPQQASQQWDYIASVRLPSSVSILPFLICCSESGFDRFATDKSLSCVNAGEIFKFQLQDILCKQLKLWMIRKRIFLMFILRVASP